jgi:hypothetical protein
MATRSIRSKGSVEDAVGLSRATFDRLPRWRERGQKLQRRAEVAVDGGGGADPGRRVPQDR